MIVQKPQKSADMRSVLLIFSDPVKSDRIGAALGTMTDVTVDVRSGTLSAMNGTAVTLAAANNLVIFETSGEEDNDIAAVSALRRELDCGARLLALTPEDTSLADARRLTRAGVDDVLTWPVDAEELRNIIDRWTRPNPLVVIAAAPETRHGRIITVAQSRGGLGATTVAVNLADRLQDRTGLLRKRTRNRVLLIDLDLQFGAAATFLDVEPRDGLFQLATDGNRPDITFLQSAISGTKSGVDLLSAPSRFMPIDSLKPEQIATMLDLLRREYDYIVVDLPRTLVQWVAPVLERTDRMLLVTDSSVPSIRQARRLINFYTEDNFGLNIEIVINHEKKPLIRSGAHAEAAKVLERTFKHWLPHDPHSARTAIDRGAPLSAVASSAGLSKAIGALGRQLLTEFSATASAQADPSPTFATSRIERR